MTPKDIERFEKFIFPEPTSGCWLWDGGMNSWGYGIFWLNGKSERANRISYQLYRGPIPDGLWALHKCDVRLCVNPDHLYLGNRADNGADMSNRNRSLRGQRNHQSKLTDADVRAIRVMPLSAAKTANLYGVSPGCIKHIRKRRQWKHVA